MTACLAGCGDRVDVPKVDFNRDIRPILTSNCTGCHGGVRKLGGLSFTFRDEAFVKGASGRGAIVPGNAHASELLARLESDDPAFRMPFNAPPLSTEEIDKVRRWIEQGAQWEEHWAFVPPKPQALPAVKQQGWVRQPLDRFVLARLEREGMQPSAQAGKSRLLRRVSFDLTGLPPSADELQSFLEDDSAQAYEKQVDRLLASPHFGERWAAMWMDLARYADSRGFEKDMSRPGAWVYRDWVVNAFNRNMPYDQFVTKQLAGDLLPEATIEDRIATAFNRLTPVNDEGGTDDEEYRTIAVMDRASTTWSALNGFTMACVQCHSHPYDPVRHEDYYRFMAFFNTTRDADLAADAPVLPVPTDPANYAKADALWRQLQATRGELIETSRKLAGAADAGWRPATILSARSNMEAVARYEIQQITDDPNRSKTPGARAEIAKLEQFIAKTKVDPSLIKPRFQIRNGEAWTDGMGRNITVYDYTMAPVPGPVTALRVEFPPADPDKARTTPEDGFIVTHVKLFKVRADGSEEPVPLVATLPDSQQTLDYRLLDLTKSGPRLGMYEMAPLYRTQIKQAGGGASLLAVDGVDAYSKITSTRWIVAVPQAQVALGSGEKMKLRLEQFTPMERNLTVRRVRAATSGQPHWLEVPTTLAEPAQRLVDLYNQQVEIDSVPLPVMAEQAPDQRRQTRLFDRGNAQTRVGPALQPGMPAIFPPSGRSADRLAMARAFFAPEAPLTARVAVNRYWEQLFGLGLVETLEDFGSAGMPPTHPQLLDWLALHYQNDLKWDSKRLLRELVLSATYRQDASASKALIAKDPRNRLLARGPRQRLTAEMVRDQALSASGLLTPRLGGPPVMPPQPDGVWKVVYSSETWTDSTGPDRYRRALYTFIKRSASYPSFLTFDAPAHEVSVARRIPTNTPLQALVAQNDPVQTEAWAALARRVLALPAATLPDVGANGDARADEISRRLNYAGRLVLSRDLTPDELADVRAYHRHSLNAATPNQAMTAVAGLLFNLDAALNR